MDTTTWIVIAVAVVAVLVILAFIMAGARRRRRHHLQQRFGAEYDRTLDAHKRRRGAEKDLAEREERREQLEIRELSPATRERYAAQWQSVQAGFVDRPESAVRQADELVREVMHERGYPVEDFDTESALVSVDYPDIVSDYRTAHGIAERSERSEATTEDLRRAVVHYRSLFEALLGDRASA